MRVVSFTGKQGLRSLGAFTERGVVDLKASAERAGVSAGSFQSMAAFLEAGEMARIAAERLANDTTQAQVLALGEVRLGAPVPRPGKIIAVGLNYRDHLMESGAKEAPTSPLIFAKFTTSICGPDDVIVLPASDAKVDYEAELGVVIGKRGKAIAAQKAYEYVAGYMPLNDVSARAWQFADKQWVRGKSCDTFCPTGPYLVTRDEVPEPHNLAIQTRVSGTVLQNSNTAKMIFHIPQLIEYISASITLEPGDIIATGTPEGVGAFREPPIYLKAGDEVEVEIEKLGVLKNPVVDTKN
jgi:2-keto-4-pentenoate hydratase/2-oxohepta-3-ene-1,7-dioic acid hydratase in catechol pathway